MRAGLSSPSLAWRDWETWDKSSAATQHEQRGSLPQPTHCRAYLGELQMELVLQPDDRKLSILGRLYRMLTMQETYEQTIRFAGQIRSDRKSKFAEIRY